ncbi:hypothetical protein VOLCADRAFT_98179 [Volvox carteri f. nagariensis]|uniref:signal-recognition-particle GTPase n=1 Tax=Volvox carteri f. nagariensis TaxID=3068 RepID=D8UEN3_VOLCA|nr:uncharacterized protein VOLCADRAFT_98179 [Volvox carteri f. nagariensis]EFJ41797.1 hypothetical protein VOLCADRAFT_98179 [Volvox carteri f. nagariensis]|eukprot:XP_002957143.1 hypothetical protein VOLCADRAFT_98179 [Volvox carteri f. nagariensis]
MSRPAALRGAGNRKLTATVTAAHLRGIAFTSIRTCQGAKGGSLGLPHPSPPLALPRRGRGRGAAVVVRAAMFDNLSKSLEKAQRLIGGCEVPGVGVVGKSGTLTAENMKEPLKEVRRALLEADVSLPVVRRFVKKVEERALGTKVIEGVTPDVQFIKVVSNELIELMGGGVGAKDLEPGFPQIILMAGLQGVGKTTAAGKLALYLKKAKKSCLLVATDVYRPAAIDQLVKLGAAIDVPVFELGTQVSGKPIKFVGVGEKMEALEPFYPERMASRILGMGDVLTLYEKAEAAIKEEDAKAVMDRLMEEKFDFNDFLNQWKSMNNMGGMQILKMMPGFNKERSNPEVIIKSLARRRRVAQDSGHSEAEVAKLMTAYTAMRTQVGGMSKLLKLQKSGGDPSQAEKLLKELVASAGKKVAPGKPPGDPAGSFISTPRTPHPPPGPLGPRSQVRRKKEKEPISKARGFGSPSNFNHDLSPPGSSPAAYTYTLSRLSCQRLCDGGGLLDDWNLWRR